MWRRGSDRAGKELFPEWTDQKDRSRHAHEIADGERAFHRPHGVVVHVDRQVRETEPRGHGAHAPGELVGGQRTRRGMQASEASNNVACNPSWRLCSCSARCSDGNGARRA